MSTYAIGDVQGCYAEFVQLLSLIQFNPSRDRLWLVGDLVNRGPASLEVIRHVKQLGDAATVVLGNHDFHLLMVAEGLAPLRKSDTIQAILDAPDRDELIHWLRRRPLIVREDNRLLVHAGLLPQWTLATAHELASEVEGRLRAPTYAQFLARLYGDEPSSEVADMQEPDRLRLTVNVCTRLRFCTPQGAVEFHEKRGSQHAPTGYFPWFKLATRLSANTTIVCGHWSALGLQLLPNVKMLDSGCVWGGSLTGLRLEDDRIYQVPSRSGIDPMLDR